MSKVIAGFFLGIVVTLAAVYWLGDPVQETQPVVADQRLSPDGESREGLRADSDRTSAVEGETEGPIDNEAGSDGEEAKPTVADMPLPGTELVASQSQTGVAPGQTVSTSTANRNPVTPGVNTDNQYPPEIAEMIESSVDKDLQARYENDEREDSWAAYMEGLLAAYFAQKPVLAQFYISLIDCRTSICSVHAVGYGPDALTQWTVATSDLVSQPWFEFNNMSMNRRNPAPDVLAVVLILTKQPPT